MRKHFFRKTTGDLIFHDTLETLQLNTTAQIIYQGVIEGKQTTEIASLLVATYKISFDEAFEDTKTILSEFQELGIDSVQSQQFLPHTIIFHIIQNCNSPCRLCDCWKTKEKTRHSLDEIKPVLSWLQKKNTQNIMVSGGEPLLHPEIESICREIKNLKMNVLLNTNGLLLHKAPWINSNTVNEVVVSMDGFDSLSYKSVRGIDGYDRVWENIKSLKQNNPQLTVSLRLILNKINLFQLPNIFEQAQKSGVSRLGISPLDISSSSFNRTSLDQNRYLQLKKDFLPSTEEITLFRQFLDSDFGHTLESYFNSGLSDWSAADFHRCLDYYQGTHEELNKNTDPCLFPINSMVIDYDGSMKACFYAKPVSTIQKPELYDQNYAGQLQEMKHSGQCKNCRGKVFCDVRV